MTDQSGGSAVAVVTPVLNDWVSLKRLIADLDRLPELAGRRLDVYAVDDGSFPPPPVADLGDAASGSGAVRSVRVVQLAANLGHQRAIAAGLVSLAAESEYDAVLVMDADGEDRPADAARLIAAGNDTAIVLALRSRRSEGLFFRAGYRVYRLLFRFLTGRTIRFGNFCLIPTRFLPALTHSPATWNNLAAAIMRSRLPTVDLPTPRGERYAGRSQMNFISLAAHGLSAISVYIDVMLIRIICAALSVSGLIAVVGLVVMCLKLFTGLAIPGWASLLGVSLLVLLFQALMFASIALFQFLSFRSMPTVVPAAHAPQLIARVIEITPS
ncbi:MAG TPA: glycosyltransferase [Caulobacteraceae bacterium]|nr:glycosyltransferase [Caulobacteraceae bacterium]